VGTEASLAEAGEGKVSLFQINLEGLNRVDQAIKDLRENEPPEGYFLAFSGGKDSVVIHDLALKAGVKFDPHYNVSGIDPPELVKFIKANYPVMGYEKPLLTLEKGIMRNGMPRRQSRWCCRVFKEHSGSGRFIITGIRAAESARRKHRHFIEISRTDKTKTFLHVILAWRNDDVWEYIKLNRLPYCSLYDEGFKRLGCVLCPMITPWLTQIELERWPNIANRWHRAAVEFFNTTTFPSISRWSTAEEMWQCWLSRGKAKEVK